MDRLGLAGLCHKRDDSSPPDGSRTHICRRYALFTLVGIAGEDDIARQIEDAFRARLATLGEVRSKPSPPSLSEPQRPPQGCQPLGLAGVAAADGIDKSRLTHPEPRRFRDKEPVRFVAKRGDGRACGTR
jgi:hypothetical protein